MSTKRTSFAELAGKKTTPGDTSTVPPVSALLHTITGNPDNPRDTDQLELDELIESFREVGQLQPVLAVSRAVYLKHKPQHAATIGDAEYVTMGGNRRLHAARALGWARIDIALRDDLGDGEGSLDEAVIIENIHRKDLTPMREAAVLRTLLDRYGSQGKVAKRIGKTQAYVSQRLSLLRLEPELQEAVDAGQLKVKDARKAATAPRGEQRAVLLQHQETRTTHNPVIGGTHPARQAPSPEPTGRQPSTTGTPAPGAAQTTAVPAQERTSPPAAPAEPSSPALGRSASLDDVPWQDPSAVRELIMEWMEPETLVQLVRMLAADLADHT